MLNRKQFLIGSVLMLSLSQWAVADQITIGALVTGQVTSVQVEPGQTVKKGRVLMTVDDEAHQANLAYLKAEHELQQAQFKDAKIELDQALDLFDRTVTARRTLDAAQLAHDVALANLNKAKAALQREQAWSKYYQIKAPINGKVVKVHAPMGSTVYQENSPLIVLE